MLKSASARACRRSWPTNIPVNVTCRDRPNSLTSRRAKAAVTAAMDAVNDRYGEFTLTWGTLLSRYRHKGVIAPAWRPNGSRRVEY